MKRKLFWIKNDQMLAFSDGKTWYMVAKSLGLFRVAQFTLTWM